MNKKKKHLPSSMILIEKECSIPLDFSLNIVFQVILARGSVIDFGE